MSNRILKSSHLLLHRCPRACYTSPRTWLYHSTQLWSSPSTSCSFASVSSLAQHASPPCPTRESSHSFTHPSLDSDTTTSSKTTATTASSTNLLKWTPPLVKIVATIGPTSEHYPVLQQVVRAGMRIMRLNFSHATDDEVELRVGNLKQCQGRHSSLLVDAMVEEDMGKNVRGILLDTKGPEIRTGKLRGDVSGKETVPLILGESIRLHTHPTWADAGSTSTDIFIDYPKLHTCVRPGDTILLSDGTIQLTVTSVDSTQDFYGTVICRIDNTAELRSRAGVNLPGIETDLPAMSAKDRRDIKFGMTKDVDYVAASFIQNAEGVREIKRYMRDCARELRWDEQYPLPLLISKIESVAALRNFDAILEESDGIMVARGDLGVEIPIQQVTLAQKEMVAACNAVGKPVIVATQMLESMIHSPRPTRAEVADVTNAVFDGADCVMLSGETAKGKYPVEAVRMMNEIICSSEKFQKNHPDLVGYSHGRTIFATKQIQLSEYSNKRDANASIAKAAVIAAAKHDAKAILVLATGSASSLPKFVSAYRPDVPIVVFCSSSKIARQLIVYRGIHPIVGKLSGISFSKRPAISIQCAKDMGFIHDGEDVVILSTENDGDVGEYATMKICTC